VKQETSRQSAPPPKAPTPSQPVAPSPKPVVHAQNGSLQYPPSTPTSSASSATPRSGPAVVVKPLPPSAQRDEYRRYEDIKVNNGHAQQEQENLQQEKRQQENHQQENHQQENREQEKRQQEKRQQENREQEKRQQENRQQDSGLSMLRPQERELAEQKIERLQKFVTRLGEEKEDSDHSEYFAKVACLDTDLTVMSNDTLSRLYDRVMAVCATGCFSSVSVDVILQIQSLCEPSVAAMDQPALFSQGELETWDSDLRIAESGLRAAKLALTSMLEGREDRRITPEDLVVVIIDGMKRVLELCIFPVTESRRSGESPELFSHALSLKDKMLSVLRLCTSVMRLLANVIGKVSLSDSAVNPIEYLALALLIQQNSDSEKDSVLGLQRFETLRQAAMEVLVQIFASHADHQQYIIAEILNNLEKLPDKGINARQFKSARDPPIMTVSALFLRFVQVAATYHPNQHRKVDAPKPQHESADEKESDSDSETPLSQKAKSRAKGQEPAKSIARGLMANATGIAARIAVTLSQRALNVSKTGDKPFRNLLDMFVEDFCNVLGSPEWPAAPILLQRLFTHMFTILKGQANRDMALSLLGTMGCGIIDFKLRVKRLKHDLDISQSELSAQLEQLAVDALDRGMHKKDLLSFKGPYRMVIESLPDYLKLEVNQDDPHLHSVRGCYVALWLDSVGQALASSNDDAPPDQVLSNLEVRLEGMILDPKWLPQE
jgi:cohesin loading factor subunit SCC2